ncbi:MAG: glutathione synthase [Nitrospirota bacterium]|jgi:glutathione synthase
MSSGPVIGVVMDEPATLAFGKDSTYAMMAAAEPMGARFEAITLADLDARGAAPWAVARPLRVAAGPPYLEIGEAGERCLDDYACVLMRKDPPFDLDYICATYVLSLARCPVINDPRGLRDVNEKFSVLAFPEWSPPTIATMSMARILSFVVEMGAAVVKPPGYMGGRDIFLLRGDDPNLCALVETATDRGRRYVLVQRYLPEIEAGDKRVLLWDGAVIGVVNRLPRPGELRGNFMAGGTAAPARLTDRERRLVAEVGERLLAGGLRFVGLDLIGEHLTEINVTSPTGMREVERLTGESPARIMMERLLATL